MINPYPFQQEAIDSVNNNFADGNKSVLVCVPTGGGKTVIAGAIAKHVADRGGRSLFITNRGELVDQALTTFRDEFGLRCAIEQAEQRAFEDCFHKRIDVVIASKDSLQNERLEPWPQRFFDLIFTDEAHHASAQTYQNIYQYFERFNHCGLTATPDRHDGQSIAEIFPTLAYEFTLQQAINGGYLVRPVYMRPKTQIDLSAIRTTRQGDLNQGDLEDLISRNIEELVNMCAPHIGKRSSITFTPDVGSATAFHHGISQLPTYNISSRWVSGKSKDRKEIVTQLGRGEIQHVANCMLYTEGFDCPRVSELNLMRPTESGPLYRQMVGRGLRLFEGKTTCAIVDPAWVSGKHELIRPIDLFDTSQTDVEVLKIADEMMRQIPQTDPLKVLAFAQRKHDRKIAEAIHKQQVELEVAVKERKSKFQLIAFDPFVIGAVLGVKKRYSMSTKPLKQWHLEKLAKLKINPEGVSPEYAEALFKARDQRAKDGLATHRMVMYLVDLGTPMDIAQKMSFNDVRERLDSLVGPLAAK